MDRIGIGVVGAGAIGINAAFEHLSLDDVQDRVRLAAVCDPVEGRAKAAAEKYKVAAYYMTLEELLADRNVDVVTLCSPIGLHFAQGMAAVEAGKHVHFNKTMCLTTEEATGLIKAAKKRNVRLVASPGQMIQPYNRKFRRMIQEGKLGTLMWGIAQIAISHFHTHEKVRHGDGLLGNIDPSWYYRKPGGGPLYDSTVYSLHSLTGLVGPVKRVAAMSGLIVKEREYRGKKIECDMDDTTLMLLDFGSNFFAFAGGTVVGGLGTGNDCAVFGQLGTISGTRFTPKVSDTFDATFGKDGTPQEMNLPGDHQPHVVGQHDALKAKHVFEDIMQLVDWVREGKPSVATAEHARHVVEIIECAYRAAATGRTQKLKTTYTPSDLLAEEV
jgi:predicted dehydrogenase